MTIVKFVKPEHVDILREYLDADGVVLIFPEVAAEAEFNVGDEDIIDYDWSDADIFVDIVDNTEHPFFVMQEEAREEKAETQRRDEKNGLYPEYWDYAN